MRRIGFNDGGTGGRGAARRRWPGLVALAFAVLVLDILGVALVVRSLERGDLFGIAFGMIWAVAVASLGFTAVIRALRRDRDRLASENHQWRLSSPPDDTPDP